MAVIGSLHDRAQHWSELQKCLKDNGVKNQQIADLSGIDKGQVSRVLNKGRFSTVRHGTVLRVRDAALKLLPDVPDSKKREMLAEYDREALLL